MPFAWFWPVVVGGIPYAICMVLVGPGYNCGRYPMPFTWFWRVVARIVQDAVCHLHGFGQSWLELWWISYAICMVLANRGYSCEGCPMPFAWFWPVVVGVVTEIPCHFHGFGQSWLEL